MKDVADHIVFPPLPDDVFAAKLAKWEKRQHVSKSKRTNMYGRLFAQHEAVRFDEAVARRKHATAAMRAEYLANKQGKAR